MKQKIAIISLLLTGCLFLACTLPFTISQPGTPVSTAPIVTETATLVGATVSATQSQEPTSAVTPLAPAKPVVTAVVLLPFVSGQASPPIPAPQGNDYYIVQVGTPLGTANFIHPEAGCNWTGIGGQVFNLEGKAVTGLVVQVGGALFGTEFLSLGITGNSPALGEGGYEVKLADYPVATKYRLWVQLFDVSGNPLSKRVFIETYAVCDQNLILLNFTEVRSNSGVPVYMPIVTNR